MYAIIETGGKQYKVTPGQVLTIEKLQNNVGDHVKFDKVLLVSGKEGAAVVGAPYIANASLEGEVVEQGRGEKLLIIKYRRRKGYRRTLGHRQSLTRVLITKMSDGKGGVVEFDASKRRDTLMKANIATSAKASAKKAAAPAAKKAAAPQGAKKAASTTKKAASSTVSKPRAKKASK